MEELKQTFLYWRAEARLSKSIQAFAEVTKRSAKESLLNVHDHLEFSQQVAGEPSQYIGLLLSGNWQFILSNSIDGFERLLIDLRKQGDATYFYYSLAGSGTTQVMEMRLAGFEMEAIASHTLGEGIYCNFWASEQNDSLVNEARSRLEKNMFLGWDLIDMFCNRLQVPHPFSTQFCSSLQTAVLFELNVASFTSILRNKPVHLQLGNPPSMQTVDLGSEFDEKRKEFARLLIEALNRCGIQEEVLSYGLVPYDAVTECNSTSWILESDEIRIADSSSAFDRFLLIASPARYFSVSFLGLRDAVAYFCLAPSVAKSDRIDISRFRGFNILFSNEVP